MLLALGSEVGVISGATVGVEVADVIAVGRAIAVGVALTAGVGSEELAAEAGNVGVALGNAVAGVLGVDVG